MQKISITYISRKTTQKGDTSSVYLNIRISGFSPYRVSSGFVIPTKNFIKGGIVGNGKEISKIRKRLEALKEKIESAFYEFEDQNKVPDPRLILQYVSNQKQEALTVLKLADMVIDQKKSELAAGNCTPHLVEKFTILKGQIEIFITQELKKNDVFLAEANFDFVMRFRMFLQTRFENGNVTINKKIANLGQIFKYAVKNEWMRKDPTMGTKKLTEKSTNHEFLTEHQLGAVMRFELPNESHQVIKDSFLFMAFTGMAYSDMAKFQFKDIIHHNGEEVLTYTRKKTGVSVLLPMNNILAELISRHFSIPVYDKKKKRKRSKTEHDPIFTTPSMQVYNRKIKRLFEFNELTLDFEITSHCARKTFGNLVNKELGLSAASQLLGHSSISITEKNYVDNHNDQLGLQRGGLLNERISELFKNNK